MLVQHTLQVVEMVWRDESTLATSLYMYYRSLHCTVVRRGWSPMTYTGALSRATKTNGIDCHTVTSITLATE